MQTSLKNVATCTIIPETAVKPRSAGRGDAASRLSGLVHARLPLYCESRMPPGIAIRPFLGTREDLARSPRDVTSSRAGLAAGDAPSAVGSSLNYPHVYAGFGQSWRQRNDLWHSPGPAACCGCQKSLFRTIRPVRTGIAPIAFWGGLRTSSVSNFLGQPHRFALPRSLLTVHQLRPYPSPEMLPNTSRR